MDNREVARALREIGKLLEVEGESAFKVRAYLVAADRVAALADPLAALAAQGALRDIPGVGAAIAQKIESLLETGHVPLLDRLRAKYPGDVADLLRIPEIGPRKVGQLVEAGITSVEGLERAARDGRLARIKGFGGKTQSAILQGIEALRRHAGARPLAQALPLAEELLSRLDEDPGVLRSSLAGEVRRWQESVQALAFVAATADPEKTLDWFASAGPVEAVTEATVDTCSVRLHDDTVATLHVTPPDDFVPALLVHTGPPEHVALVQRLAERRGCELAETGLFHGDGTRLDPPDEEAIYAALGMQHVPPELRHDHDAFAAALRGALPRLVEMRDIRGFTHCHTTYSDGKATVLEMAHAARARGLRYLTITDHSQSSHYAGGLRPDDLRRQWDEIDAAQELVPEVRLLRGSEVDILADGSLDYPDDILEQLDVVVGSIHQRHGLDEDGQTRRLLRATAHPLLSWIGHPTGRLVGSRDPIPVRMEEVLEAAAEHGKALEVNGSPHRLDLSGEHVRMAVRAGVKLVLSVDAHSTAGLDVLRWAVATARRGWATPADVLNTQDADGFLASLRGGRLRPWHALGEPVVD